MTRLMNKIILFLTTLIFSFKLDADDRWFRYESLSKSLEALSEDDLLSLLKQGTPLESSWGSTLRIEFNGIPIFVKLISLNEVEGNEENLNSTRNVFKIPLYYQYGVGSSGFNVWREVAANEKATEWVLAGKTINFPMLYHYRIIKNFKERKPLGEEEFQKEVAYWGNSKEIGDRIIANERAESNVVLFSEYIPEKLKTWLHKELKKGNRAIDKAIAMVEKELQETTLYLKNEGMIHFDAHFHNILTDGEHLYFSDFGLALSSEFDLSEEEVQFFNLHKDYDRYFVLASLANWIVANTFGKEGMEEVMKVYAEDRIPEFRPDSLTPFLESILKRNAALTFKMGQFFNSLIKETKETPYPSVDLENELF
ncbi:putative secreted protein [Criblamydia sequanensis CRIB-18]|uniref:Secreted protein n=2 Tax=Candidatus Criblamydia sequanensis TaxID=340071 RepID=A0A090CZE2_9BACT|nr:putative secreted protein [Criblamydia sequanensis CRIB-18]